MIYTIIKYFAYMVAEVLPLGGEIHFKLMTHYFNYPPLSNDELAFIYTILLLSLTLYFIRDIVRSVKELFRVFWLLVMGRGTIKNFCFDFKMLNVLLVTVVLCGVSFPFFVAFSGYSYSLYLSGALLIVSAAFLRLSEIFTLIKLDGKAASVKETTIFCVLHILSFIPGLSRTAVMMGAGKFLGFERKHLATLTLISFIPVVIFHLYGLDIDWVHLFALIYSQWKIFFILLGLMTLCMDLVFMIITSANFYKFYYYLAGLGIWTILDVFFIKRGL